MPSNVNLRIVWVGRFKVGIGERKDLRLEFSASTVEVATKQISLYIQTKVDKSWVLESDDMHVTYNN